jgi:hypothetical protein
MNTDELIEMLARDATPVRRLAAPWLRTATWLVMSGLYVALLIVLMSPSLDRITGIGAPRLWLEQVAALTTGIAAAAAALMSVVPGRAHRPWLLPIVPLGLWIGIVLWGCVRDWTAGGSAGLVVHSDWPCVLAMVLGALLPATAMAVMLRRGAPLAPRVTAASAGLAAAALSSVAACLSRPTPHSTTVTVLIWHFGTLLVLTSVAAWAGRYLRGWRLTPAVAAALGNPPWR